MKMNNKDPFPLHREVRDLYGTEEWKEGLNLEFKSGKGGLPKEFWPTYSAFANTKGGIILLGVADDGTIEGLVKPDERKNDLAVQLNNPQKCSSNLSSLPGMIEEVKIDGKIILAIRIPAAELKDRPIYIHGHLWNTPTFVNTSLIFNVRKACSNK